ncbi:hypothetical protein MTR67_043859 [Solanum verrucosum]|uniref:Uncharacterized protein n=1 Tax=Solanum verrucosum TaxID=315347 RepID=A0AAF0USE5_SOLVR|nr:hypothetical protein MTR67_043859 [Solanum verrucosum]
MPTMKFGENQVVAIADKSLVFTLEFDEAFNLIFSIFIAYDRYALAYHCILKSKAQALISHALDAHNNTFTELFVVAYARVHVETRVFQAESKWTVPLLDTLDNHVCENIAIACCITLWHHQSILTCLQPDFFVRDGLKFPDHLIVQVRGSLLVRVESSKSIGKYNMLMKLVIVLEDLVTIGGNNLQIAAMSAQIAQLTSALAESERRRVTEQQRKSATVQKIKEQVLNLARRPTTFSPTEDTDDDSEEEEDDFVDATP